MSTIKSRIKKIKKEKNAVILAHNYQLGEIQDIADFCGDSLELAKKAAGTGAGLVIFCGVKFMAETASILCPDKKIIMPDKNAGCPMAEMAGVEKLKTVKQAYPDAAVVTYVNSTAEIKAESDICCTSANAVEIVDSLEEEEVIFLPDKYLGRYVASKTKKKIIFWEGYCPSHVKILAEDIKREKEEYPEADVLVHPECTPGVIALADEVLSTGGMRNHVDKSRKKEFIIGTEAGMLYRLRKDNPDKMFFPASTNAVCMSMKLGMPEKVLWSLEHEKTEVKVPEEISIKARKAIDRMLEVKVES